MNRHEGLQPAILTRLAAGPATATELWHHVLADDIDCTEATVRRNLRHLRYRGLAVVATLGRRQSWSITSDGAETREILRCVS